MLTTPSLILTSFGSFLKINVLELQTPRFASLLVYTSHWIFFFFSLGMEFFKKKKLIQV